VCPCVDEWLQKSVSFAESQRSASPVATERVDGRLAPDGSQELGRSEKASIACIAVAKPQCKRSPKPGARKCVAGRWSLLDGRHPGWLQHRASFHASTRRVVLAALTEVHDRASGMSTMREATGVVRGSVCTRHGGKTTPTATTPLRDKVRPAEANRPDREPGDLLDRADAQALDATENLRGTGARTKT